MDDSEGLTALEHAVGRDPADGEAWSRLGEAYYGLGQYEPATIAFREATRYAPGSAWAWLGLATNLLGLGQGAGALVAARRAERLAPQIPAPRVCVGRALLLLDRPLEALAEFEEAARLGADWNMALVERGHSLARLGWHEMSATRTPSGHE